MKCKSVFFTMVLFLLSSWGLALAGPTTAPDYEALGPKFSSAAYGIELNPPANCAEIHKATTGTIVEFVQDDRNWELTVSRATLERSLPLTTHNNQFGQAEPGELDQYADFLTKNNPGATILRREAINVGRVRVGMIAMRYDSPMTRQRRLSQIAIVEALNADFKLYYVLGMDSPAKPVSEPDDIINPGEKLAADVFAKVVDSIKLLDRGNIVQDQDQRLYNTRSLFVNWVSNRGAAVKAALLPEQWQRIVRDGKDIGFTYVTEELVDNERVPELSEIRISVKSRLKPSPDAQWDTQTNLTSTVDHKHESWTTAAKCTGPKGQPIDDYTQVGSSDEQTKAVVNNAQQGADGALGQGGGVDIETVRNLDITTTQRNMQSTPYHREVPVFYIPQAFSFMLPSLVPVGRPHPYMFATFVPASNLAAGRNPGAIMARYLDVMPAQEVRFNHEEYPQVVPVVDKIGLEGPPTTNYFTLEGKFIGSTSTFTDGDKDSTVTIIPTDAAGLKAVWGDIDLTMPHSSLEAPTAANDAPAQ